MPQTKENRKIYRLANKENLANYEFERGLRRNYGISVEVYNHLFAQQNGNCALCGKHQSDFKRRLHVDHNHATKEIRSLLCTRCNPLIGYAEESVERLQAAIDYLNKFKK
jgi:hypothetical protein